MATRSPAATLGWCERTSAVRTATMPATTNASAKAVNATLFISRSLRGCAGAAAAARRHWLGRAARRRAGDFGKVVLQHDERLPLVAVRVVDPCLVLRRVAAVGLH